MYSQETYELLMRRALSKGYQFIDFLTPAPTDTKYIYLRHDVIWSIQMALELAKINHNLGIKGTFFVSFRAPRYNLASPVASLCMQSIHELGQHIGFLTLPSESTFNQSFSDEVRKDYDWFAMQFPAADPVFAWHAAPSEVIKWGLIPDVPGLTNADNFQLRKNHSTFYSDTLERYAIEELENVINVGRESILLSLYPDFWIAGGKNFVKVATNIGCRVLRDLGIDAEDLETVIERSLRKHFPGDMVWKGMDKVVDKLIELYAPYLVSDSE